MATVITVVNRFILKEFIVLMFIVLYSEGGVNAITFNIALTDVKFDSI